MAAIDFEEDFKILQLEPGYNESSIACNLSLSHYIL